MYTLVNDTQLRQLADLAYRCFPPGFEMPPFYLVQAVELRTNAHELLPRDLNLVRVLAPHKLAFSLFPKPKEWPDNEAIESQTTITPAILNSMLIANIQVLDETGWADS